MYRTLKGSFDSHARLFKLVQLLTFFTLKLREKIPETTTKDILVKWFANSESESIRLREGSDSLVDDLNDMVMPYVTLVTYEKNRKLELYGLTTPEEIKKEILFIINEYWLPF
jgi:hypothetical protein